MKSSLYIKLFCCALFTTSIHTKENLIPMIVQFPAPTNGNNFEFHQNNLDQIRQLLEIYEIHLQQPIKDPARTAELFQKIVRKLHISHDEAIPEQRQEYQRLHDLFMEIENRY